MAGPMDYLSGDFLTGKEDGKAKKYMEQSMAAWDGLQAPNLDAIDFDQFDYLGDLDAEQIASGGDITYNPLQAKMAQASSMGPTAMEQVSVDPRLAQQQMASLASLQEIVDGGGLNAMDKANLAKIQTQTATADRGRRDAIRQNMSSRGMGGSGMDLLAQLQSSQGASDQAAQESLDVAGMAEQRSLQAMMQSGQLAGNIRNQSHGEQSQLAQARDAISQFNTQNRNQFNLTNTGAANSMAQFNAGNKLATDTGNRDNAQQVAMYNADQRQGAKQASWGARQNTSDQNVGVANTGKMHNQFQIPQANFQNKATVAGGKAGAAETGMNYWGAKAQGKKDAWGNVVGGAATAALMFSDERLKKDIKEPNSGDIEEFLNALSPKSFKYKDEAHGKGEFTGPMAQDLQKTKLGRDAVVETDGGLAVDMQKMQGIQLAALKYLAGKVK